MDLALTEIRTDGGTQPRAEMNAFTVAAYSADMEAGDHFPPVLAFYDGAEYWLADGFHRVEAARRIGWASIAADVRQGTCRDAVLYSVGANATHGLRRTNEDKRRAVLTLLNDAEWFLWSDREIARRAAVDNSFVSDLRKLSLLVNNSEDRTYTTKHGTVTTMNTARIGKPAPSPVALQFLAERASPEIKEELATGGITIHEALWETRKAIARERVPEPVPAAIPLPTGRYRCLVLDPPWPVQKIERDERPDQGVALDYPTMTLDEIAALPVADLAEPDGCHLYLWTTHHFLPDALALVGGWGFRYQCLLTWVKPTGMTPYSWMYNTEHVIFARYGALRLERLGLKLAFEAPVIRHSQKPDVFYERAMQASPGPRLEMFARQRRDGFTAWGSDRGLEDSSYVS